MRDCDSEAPSRRRTHLQTHQLMTPQPGNPLPDRVLQCSVIHHLMRLNQDEIVGVVGYARHRHFNLDPNAPLMFLAQTAFPIVRHPYIPRTPPPLCHEKRIQYSVLAGHEYCSTFMTMVVFAQELMVLLQRVRCSSDAEECSRRGHKRECASPYPHRES